MFATVAAQSRYQGGGGGGDFAGAGSFSDPGADYDIGGGSSGVSDLEQNIPGVPGDDYPIFAEVPDTSFFCDGLVEGGYYADPEAECQAFHICAADGTGGLTKYSFLCPNGTIFQQQYFVCDWWFNVDCSLAESLYVTRDFNAGAVDITESTTEVKVKKVRRAKSKKDKYPLREKSLLGSDYEAIGSPGFGGGGRYGADGIFHQFAK